MTRLLDRLIVSLYRAGRLHRLRARLTQLRHHFHPYRPERFIVLTAGRVNL